MKIWIEKFNVKIVINLSNQIYSHYNIGNQQQISEEKKDLND